MQQIMEKLQLRLQDSPDDEVVKEALAVITELRGRESELEKVLIMLVRTGWPWDENGTPNGILPAAGEGYAGAIREAKILTGLDYRSSITRTEPRT